MEINNKKIIRSLLRKSEILNTINGGSSMPLTKKFYTPESMVVCVKAPGVPSEAYQIVLNDSELVIFTVLTLGSEERKAEDLMAVPTFMKSFKVPDNVNTDQIEALYEDGELRVILPFHQKVKNKLRKIRVKQI